MFVVSILQREIPKYVRSVIINFVYFFLKQEKGTNKKNGSRTTDLSELKSFWTASCTHHMCFKCVHSLTEVQISSWFPRNALIYFFFTFSASLLLQTNAFEKCECWKIVHLLLVTASVLKLGELWSLLPTSSWKQFSYFLFHLYEIEK